ncbi:MAG: tRNA uridine-5-carboxymethylaminomethyl(34) synthesis GTPase MnmE [Sphingobium sp.]|nr:tRNA uridine-5-carboxymethylaminomethyl(34) synthesis GTPase MnmE [Sphingobium sp.]
MPGAHRVPKRTADGIFHVTGRQDQGAPDTIFALSSGALPAAIGVIRISGPRAVEGVAALVGSLPEVRQARLRRIVDPESGELLDEGLVVWFPTGRSETGEDLVELHCHGSKAAIRAVEEALARREGLRPAQPGEFTRRAFLNGKTDLARIEGLADLIHAETAPQRRAAMAMMGGALSRRIADWSQRLGRIAARVEAVLDFSDEGDIDETVLGRGIGAEMREIATEIATDLARPSAERLKEGVRVVIAGPPNAGKSTLLNALVGRDAAIVSPIAGTTRDVIEVPVALGGTAFLLADTAGLHDANHDAIEVIGMARAQQMLEAADIVLWLGQAEEAPLVPGTLIPIRAKSDLEGAPSDSGPCALAGLAVSAVTWEGLDTLIETLRRHAADLLPAPGDYALSARQKAVMTRAQQALVEGAGLKDEILIAEQLRTALAALDEITGRATTEAVLDELFSGFCIGK